jgi:hypothetical protein
MDTNVVELVHILAEKVLKYKCLGCQIKAGGALDELKTSNRQSLDASCCRSDILTNYMTTVKLWGV